LSNQGWQDRGMTKRMQNLECKCRRREVWAQGAVGTRGTEKLGNGPRIRKPSKRGARNQRRARMGKTGLRSGVDLGKGGKMKGKWTGFSHLCPDDSMQVVDFPLLSRFRVFWLRVERGGGQWTVDQLAMDSEQRQ